MKSLTIFAVHCAACLAVGNVGAAPQVVSDEACEHYAIDIDSFATCEDGKVVRAQDDTPSAQRGGLYSCRLDSELPSHSESHLIDGQFSRSFRVALGSPEESQRYRCVFVSRDVPSIGAMGAVRTAR